MTPHAADTAPDLVIYPLTPDRADDFFQLFDHAAFTDNADWAGCYCMFYYLNDADGPWGARDGAENRAAKAAQIREGRARGLLAYRDGRPVAWCNASPRPALRRLPDDPALIAGPPDQTGTIICFVVAPPYRSQGIARQLLDAACGYLAEQGMTVAEACPRTDPQTPAEAYRGSLALFLAAGFTPVHDLGDGFVIVRKTLDRKG